jgi:tetrahydromethanopterin S-methyltransferase subunit H
MKLYQKEQKISKFGSGENEVIVGGQPGQNPTCLIGTIFYEGHKIVSDSKTGEFDKAAAEKEIIEAVEFSKSTGNPLILDVVGETPEALIKFLDFVSEKCEVPFLVDGLTDTIRIPVMRYLYEKGLKDRAIYNSITPDISQAEIELFKELKIPNALVLAMHSKYITPEKKIELLKGKDGGPKGLIPIVEELNIPNIIVDTGVMDLATIPLSVKACDLVKETFGYPAGCAPANSLSLWPKKGQFGKEGKYSMVASVNSFVVAEGQADFVLFGEVNKAKVVFPAIGIIDAFRSYYRKRYLKGETSKSGPFYKML